MASGRVRPWMPLKVLHLQIMGKFPRLADAGDHQQVFRPDFQLGQGLLEGLEDAEVAAARAPGRLDPLIELKLQHQAWPSRPRRMYSGVNGSAVVPQDQVVRLETGLLAQQAVALAGGVHLHHDQFFRARQGRGHLLGREGPELAQVHHPGRGPGRVQPIYRLLHRPQAGAPAGQGQGGRRRAGGGDAVKLLNQRR